AKTRYLAVIQVKSKNGTFDRLINTGIGKISINGW
ncbi:unnamed protein product, partial [marine sediment metagenome]